MSDAAAVIIGNEILTGKVQDLNSYTLAGVLFEQGVRLRCIEVIPDEIELIGECVKRFSKAHTYVFTSGGIGPTHDDKTYEAIAKAFNRRMELHGPTVQMLEEIVSRKHSGTSLSEARKRMAILPTPCEIISIPDLWVPLVVVENVYVLPGVPQLFSHMLKAAKTRFVGRPFHRVLIYTKLIEDDIAGKLSEIQEAYPEVEIGSYPRFEEPHYRVMLSCEGRDAALVEKAAALIKNAVQGFMNPLDSSS